MEKSLHSSQGQACPLGGTRRTPWCQDQRQALGQPGLSNAAGPTMAGPQVTLGTEMNLEVMGWGGDMRERLSEKGRGRETEKQRQREMQVRDETDRERSTETERHRFRTRKKRKLNELLGTCRFYLTWNQPGAHLSALKT